MGLPKGELKFAITEHKSIHDGLGDEYVVWMHLVGKKFERAATARTLGGAADKAAEIARRGKRGFVFLNSWNPSDIAASAIAINREDETVRFDSDIGEWVAPHPAGGEIFGATRAEVAAKLAEARRVAAKHAESNPEEAGLESALHDIAATEMRAHDPLKASRDSVAREIQFRNERGVKLDVGKMERDLVTDLRTGGVDFGYHERTRRLEELAMTADLEDRFGPVVEV
jgi:hypothetical protein